MPKNKQSEELWFECVAFLRSGLHVGSSRRPVGGEAIEEFSLEHFAVLAVLGEIFECFIWVNCPGTWCSGITSASHAEGPGSIPSGSRKT